MCSPTITKTQRNQNKVINDKNIVFRFTNSINSISSVGVNSIIPLKQVISTIEKLDNNLRQNAEVCWTHCRHNIQRFLLSLGKFFCWRIAEANWKFLKSHRQVITDVPNTWFSKAEGQQNNFHAYCYIAFIVNFEWVTSTQ